MTIDELITVANSEKFKGRIKFLMYQQAIAIRKNSGSSQNAKDVARLALEDKFDLGRIALGVCTESSMQSAASYAEVTDAMLAAAIVSVITVYL